MSFTARHYNSIQRIIRERREFIREREVARPDLSTYYTGGRMVLSDIQEQIGRMLAADNPRFDLTRYNMECEPK